MVAERPEQWAVDITVELWLRFQIFNTAEVDLKARRVVLNHGFDIGLQTDNLVMSGACDERKPSRSANFPWRISANALRSPQLITGSV